jgi:hypothetical protein
MLKKQSKVVLHRGRLGEQAIRATKLKNFSAVDCLGCFSPILVRHPDHEDLAGFPAGLELPASDQLQFLICPIHDLERTSHERIT